VDFERIFQINPYCVGVVWGDRLRPLFNIKYRRVAKMINIERLGWILDVFLNPPFLCWYGVAWSVSTPIFVGISPGG